jgi:hypothetical protein
VHFPKVVFGTIYTPGAKSYDHEQGDQGGRIFANEAIVYFGQFF